MIRSPSVTCSRTVQWAGLFVWLCCLTSDHAIGQELTSDILVEPISLPKAEFAGNVRSVQVHADFTKPPTEVEIEVDHSAYDFNDFGDALLTGQPKATTAKVHLQKVPAESEDLGTSESYDVYEIDEFRKPDQGVRLAVPRPVHADDVWKRPRLVYYNNGAAVEVLYLRVPDVVASDPAIRGLANTHLTTRLVKTAHGFKNIGVDILSGDAGALHLDPNHYHVSTDSLSIAASLLGWQPTAVTVSDTGQTDPKNRNRKLLEFSLGQPRYTRYFVVTGDEQEPPRLVVKADDRIKLVAPLFVRR